nr:hypothetical protein CFP56_16530 [Quercus suber]
MQRGFTSSFFIIPLAHDHDLLPGILIGTLRKPGIAQKSLHAIHAMRYKAPCHLNQALRSFGAPLRHFNGLRTQISPEKGVGAFSKPFGSADMRRRIGTIRSDAGKPDKQASGTVEPGEKK